MSMKIATIGEVVSNRRRQEVIRYLREEETVSINSISERIAEIEDSYAKTAYISLLQHHLPKLDDEGVVSFNERNKVTSRGEHYEEVNDSLKLLENRNEEDNRNIIDRVIRR